MEEKRFFVGLDLGQASDYTAISIIQQTWNDPQRRYEYELRYLERPALGTGYPEIVNRVTRILGSTNILGVDLPRLVLDKTGVGAPVADMFKSISEVKPVCISITAGQRPSKVIGGYNVPKRDLVFSLLAVFQSNRLKIADKLPLGKIFLDELLNFKVKIDPKTAHDSYASWREGVHDDLVLSVAMATWFGEYKFARHSS